MRAFNRQRGVALFSAIFLIVVIAAVAAAFVLTTTTQQRSSARALDAEGAYAAANGRLDIAIAEAVNDESTCEDDTEEARGYELEITCNGPVEVTEGDDTYAIYTLKVTASRGDRRAGTLVRRTVQAQVVDEI